MRGRNSHDGGYGGVPFGQATPVPVPDSFSKSKGGPSWKKGDGAARHPADPQGGSHSPEKLKRSSSKTLIAAGQRAINRSNDSVDVSPSMRHLKELKSFMSACSLQPVIKAEAEHVQAPEEVRSWISKTLASVPKQESPWTLPTAAETTRTVDVQPVTREKADEPKVEAPVADLGAQQKEVQAKRIKQVFTRFKVEGTSEVHKDDLLPALKHLGSTMALPEIVEEIANEVTSFAVLEFPDFVTFTDKFEDWEHSQYQSIFEKYDEDKSGFLDIHELKQYMVEAGFTPLRAMIQEALDLVDADGNGTLDYQETVNLINIYRQSEGFTRKELEKFDSVWKQLNPVDDSIPGKALKDLLMKFFHCRGIPIVNKLLDEAAQGRKKPGADANAAKTDVPISKGEAMIWARKFREAEFEDMRALYLRADVDGSGRIDPDELNQCIEGMGFTIHKDTVQEFLVEAKAKEVHVPGDSEDAKPAGKEAELDYDDFVNVMMPLYNREGFSLVELQQLSALFDHFGEGSSWVDTLKITDILRAMGYCVKLEEVQKVVDQVDWTGDGVLQWGEYQRLMRLYREAELKKAKDVFHALAMTGLGLPKCRLTTALIDLGLKDDPTVQHPDLRASSKSGRSTSKQSSKKPRALPEPSPHETYMDWNDFMVSFDNTRAQRVVELRRNAGFDEEDIVKYKGLFAVHDPDNTGEVQAKSIGPLLKHLGFSLNTAADRAHVLSEIDKARDAAHFAGVDKVGEKGSGTINFWVFLQLLRALSSQGDKAELEREAAAVKETGFTRTETVQFRDSFQDWIKKEEEYKESLLGPEGQSDLQLEPCKEISKDGIKRLLKSVGVQLSPELRQRLEKKLDELSPEGLFDFADFLRLMRWMLDTNFGGLRG